MFSCVAHPVHWSAIYTWNQPVAKYWQWICCRRVMHDIRSVHRPTPNHNLLLWAYFYPSLSALFFKDLPQAMKRVAKVTSPRNRSLYDLSYFSSSFTALPWQQGTDRNKNVRKWQMWIWDNRWNADWCLCVSQKRLNHRFTSSAICLCDSHSVFSLVQSEALQCWVHFDLI